MEPQKKVSAIESAMNQVEAVQSYDSIREELKNFANTTSAMTGDDFWLHNIGFECLKKVYRSLKSITASNSCIERLFSEASFVYNELAQKSNPETIEARISASKN